MFFSKLSYTLNKPKLNDQKKEVTASLFFYNYKLTIGHLVASQWLVSWYNKKVAKFWEKKTWCQKFSINVWQWLIYLSLDQFLMIHLLYSGACVYVYVAKIKLTLNIKQNQVFNKLLIKLINVVLMNCYYLKTIICN